MYPALALFRDNLRHWPTACLAHLLREAIGVGEALASHAYHERRLAQLLALILGDARRPRGALDALALEANELDLRGTNAPMHRDRSQGERD